MAIASQTWTLDGFIEYFDFFHHKMLDHKFVWVLGAGASLSSGIPLGSHLVDAWLREIHIRECSDNQPLEQWACAENLGIADFKYANRATFYSRVFERRFQEYPEEGFAYLESEMCDAEPSPGYSILAAALAGNHPSGTLRHNAVVTTNFDNLVASALSIYTDVFPFVCGHESLTPFVRVAMRRPLICKIHRDLLFAPQNDSRSLRRLHDAWGKALRTLFEHYTPIFIGYGGNDDTLMSLLEWIQPGDIKGQLIWCYHQSGSPGERIVNVVADHRGILVPVPDFDLLMLQLGEKMGIGLQDDQISRRAEKRKSRYVSRVLAYDSVSHPAVLNALAVTFKRSGGWWLWHQKANAEEDPHRQHIVYEQGIESYPDSASLRLLLSLCLKRTKGPQARISQLLEEAVKIDGQNAAVLAHQAHFLSADPAKHDDAETIFERAIEIDSKNLAAITLYAEFLSKKRGEFELAETYHKRALELDSTNPTWMVALGIFLTVELGRHAEAGDHFRNAIVLEPNNARFHTTLGAFLLSQGDLTGASEQLSKANGLTKESDIDTMMGISLNQAILAGVQGMDDTAAIERLQCLLEKLGPHTRLWTFRTVLEFAQQHVSEDDFVMYSAFAAAINDSDECSRAIALFKKRNSIGEPTNRGNSRQRANGRQSARTSKASSKKRK